MSSLSIKSPSEKTKLGDLTSDLLTKIGVPDNKFKQSALVSFSPITGEGIGGVSINTPEEMVEAISTAEAAFKKWRSVPAPKRGELIRIFGEELRRYKPELGQLVTLESGKIYQEGLGEVQEMIDICEFAVGLSRQLYGLTIASERPGHRMMETWHPLGVVGLITPFNFPVAVWAWNFALAIVCGNSTVWKPSEKTPLTALACQHLFEQAVQKYGSAPDGLSCLIQGGRDVTDVLVDHPKVALVSATGSTEMGRSVGQRVAKRFGKCLLELGGNNAMVLAPSADLNLAYRAITFSAVGTSGQRCTTLRRLFVHESLKSGVLAKLKSIYNSIPIGNPLDNGILCGPLIDQLSFHEFEGSVTKAQSEGGTLIAGGRRVLSETYPDAYYVAPALIDMPDQTAVVHSETFAPILYVMTYSSLQQAIEMNNQVPQGLSSCIFTTDVREAEYFLSALGSDCGIANVNIGPSGAEIGGAFGGEKETGGGRESGSDSWRNYMRRATNTINYSQDLPLAQGIKFDL